MHRRLRLLPRPRKRWSSRLLAAGGRAILLVLVLVIVTVACKRRTEEKDTSSGGHQNDHAVNDTASRADEARDVDEHGAEWVPDSAVKAMNDRKQQIKEMDAEPSGLPGLPGGSDEVRAVLVEGWRARHEEDTDRAVPETLNRLVLEESPYLLQHQTNPVNWYPWGDEAFEQARRRDVPIFLSIGYSTCHWCHVMEHESFEDPEVAAVINAHFVPVKVDREERPDVDGVYMKAVQAMTGRGGWPMTVVMSPDGEPFFAATYIPARDGDRGVKNGLVTVLGELSKAWENDRDRVEAHASRIVGFLRRGDGDAAKTEPAKPERVDQTVHEFYRQYDPQWGGFGRAPKFPRVAALRLVLAYGAIRNDSRALGVMKTTLDAMAQGGIYDHAGGGFHRYSVDREWLVPHFEKMLYDNAQLGELYLRAAQVYDSEGHARVGRETLDYLLREMRAPEGGFYSATDADSDSADGESMEGYYFTWTPAELASALSEEQAQLARDFYGVSAEGNFEGRTILHAPVSREEFAAKRGISVDELDDALAGVNQTLRRWREQHHAPPHLDDKIITAWNGLTLSALATGYDVLGDRRYLDAARDVAEFLLTTMRDDSGRLFRRFRNGERRYDGVLDDYAFVVRGLLALFEVDPDARWLRSAMELQRVVDEEFFDEESGRYFLTADHAESLLVRERPLYDGAEPSGNSVTAENLVMLHAWTDDDAYRARYDTVFAALASVLSQQGTASPWLVLAFDLARHRLLEVVVTDGTGRESLREVLRSRWLPYAVRVEIPAEGATASQIALVPWLADKRSIGGAATAFVCEEGRCELPTSEPTVFASQLQR